MDSRPNRVPLSEILARSWAEFPDRPAMVHNGIALSCTRAFNDIERIAGQLVELGIRPGEIVAVFVRKPVTHWMVTLGLMRVGAVSLSLTANAHAELAALENVSALVCGPGEEDAFPEVARRFAVEPHWLQRAGPASGSLPPVEDANRSVGRICFTSGTSGRPKAILLDARLLAARLSGTARRAGIDRNSTLWCGLGPDTAYGFTATIATWLEGGTVVLSTGDRGAFEQMHVRGVNIVIASPAALGSLVRDAVSSGLPRIEGPAIVAGGRLSASFRDQIAKHVFSEVKVAYGSSEAGGVTLGDANDLDIHPGRVGVVFPDVDVAVVDGHGAVLPPETEGRLKVRSDSTVDRYVNDPAATEQFFQDGWFLPGDIARISRTGTLTLLGRTAQILNLGGVKVPVEEVENRVGEFDAVDEVCAFLLARTSSDPGLVIVLVASPDTGQEFGNEIRAALPRLPPFLLFTARDIPRGSMGKIRKQEVADAVGKVLADPSGARDALGVTHLGTF